MRKIWNVIIVFMLLISITAFAIADENNDNDEDILSDETGEDYQNETNDLGENESDITEDNETDNDNIDNETEDEIQIMNNSLGAEIRLLQLEKSLTKNIDKGEKAIVVLQSMGFNTTVLEAIIAEMKLLLEEVQSADAEAEDAVQQFVDLKSDACDLTKEFRMAVKDILGDEKIKELKEQVQEMVSEQVQNLSKKIQNRIRQFNRNQLHRLYGLLGDLNDSVFESYYTGEMTMEQVRIKIKEMTNELDKEQKYNIFSELKEEQLKKKIQAKSSADSLEVNFQERQQNRFQERLQKAEDKGNFQLKEKIQEKIQENKNNDNNQGNNGNGNSNNGNKGNGKGNK